MDENREEVIERVAGLKQDADSAETVDRTADIDAELHAMFSKIRANLLTDAEVAAELERNEAEVGEFLSAEELQDAGVPGYLIRDIVGDPIVLDRSVFALRVVEKFERKISEADAALKKADAALKNGEQPDEPPPPPPLRILVLCGKVGRGKSLPAARYLARRSEKTLSSFWISADKYCTAVRTKDAAVLGRFRNSTRVVLDEVGDERPDTFGGNTHTVQSAIIERFELGLELIVTTNLTLDDFGKLYGDRTVSRINQCGALVECKGEDMRETRALRQSEMKT